MTALKDLHANFRTNPEVYLSQVERIKRVARPRSPTYAPVASSSSSGRRALADSKQRHGRDVLQIATTPSIAAAA